MLLVGLAVASTRTNPGRMNLENCAIHDPRLLTVPLAVIGP
jgi:hypothetical protein